MGLWVLSSVLHALKIIIWVHYWHIDTRQKLVNILNLVKDMNCIKWGEGRIGCQTSSSSSSAYSFTFNKATLLCENSADPMIKPKPVKNSSLENFLHFAFAFLIASFNFITLLFQSRKDTVKNLYPQYLTSSQLWQVEFLQTKGSIRI